MKICRLISFFKDNKMTMLEIEKVYKFLKLDIDNLNIDTRTEPMKEYTLLKTGNAWYSFNTQV